MIKKPINKECLLIIIFITLIFCATASINGIPVYARVKESWSNNYGEISKKANMTGVVRCYNGGKMVKTIDNISNFDNISDITINDEDWNYIALPSGLTNAGDDAISCAQLYGQHSYFSGVFTLSGKSEYSGWIRDDVQKEKLLNGMGYVQSGEGSNCAQYQYKAKNKTVKTKAICLKDGKLESQGTSGMGEALKFSIRNNTNELYIIGKKSKNDRTPDTTIINYDDFDNWNEFVKKINAVLGSDYVTIWDEGYNSNGITYELDKEYAYENTISGSAFNLSNQKVSYLEALKFIAGYESYNDLMFSKTEQLQYFIGVLRDFYNVDVDCSSDPSFLTEYTPIKIDMSGGTLHKSDSCYVKPKENADKKAHGFTDSSDPNYKLFDANGSHGLNFAEVIDEIKKLADDMDDEDLSGVSASGATKTGLDKCLSSDAVDNLGWVICTVLDIVRGAADEAYNGFVEPALQIEPKLFSNGGSLNSGPTYEAWGIFQNFANVTFVIFLLFVIFSQLTGVGIDNYGIKKVLPKMIVAAILINFSYLICVLCVDLSNILGNALQDLFVSLGANVQNKAIYGEVSGSALGSTIVTAVPLIGALVAAWHLVTPAILLGLLVSAIGVAISIFFLFVLLAGREAAIVVLTVISPLAFLCYMLPNTKKLFDKWVKIVEGLLLVYPIAGLLIGGGHFVSTLLIAAGGDSNNFITAFTAMMVSIVPIFFIPKVLKSSFSALGAAGVAFAGLGARLSGKATSGVKNSGAYKETQQRAKEWQAKRRAGIGEDGKPIDVSKMSRASRFLRGISVSNRGIARNRAQYNKDQKDRDAENLLLDPTYMGNMEAHRAAALSNEREKMYSEVYERETDRNRVEKELNTALRGNDAERASAALNSLIKKGGVDEAFNALKGANWSSMNSSVRDRVVQTMSGSGIDAMSAFAKYKNNNGVGSFSDWSKGVASDANTVKYGSYARYLQEKGSNALDNYGKDEMQFVSGLQNDLIDSSKGMGAQNFGRMIGNAGINSKDASVQKEAYGMIRQQIGSGSMTVEDMNLTASKTASMHDAMADAILNGYGDYISANNRQLTRNQAITHAEAMMKKAFSQQISDIQADGTGRLLGGMESGTRSRLGL